MKYKKTDIEADILPDIDRGESISMMDPLLLSEGSRHRQKLTDLAMKLVSKSAGFKRSLPLAIQTSLTPMIRAMNCYYSNFIEGHDTHPIDIERALQGHYSHDIKKRNLQKEARAHIAVQEWIEEDGITENFFSEATICDIHRRFCELLPEDLLWIENPDTQERIKVIPGALRHRDVKVGNHLAISPGVVPQFLARFGAVYNKLTKTETILALAISHHRLLWIHPFVDGNGRVARLISHAAILNLLDTGGVWSIARGLARHVTDYKGHLANCDLSRRNDLDGRGYLSEEAAVEFTQFFLEICIDQVDFMEKLMQPSGLRARMVLWAREEIEQGNLPTQVIPIIESLLYRGEVPRGEVASILNVTERHARRVTAALVEKSIVMSDSPKAHLKLIFSATLAGRWMPGLFPPR
jgi:Fic family protein